MKAWIYGVFVNLWSLHDAKQCVRGGGGRRGYRPPPHKFPVEDEQPWETRNPPAPTISPKEVWISTHEDGTWVMGANGSLVSHWLLFNLFELDKWKSLNEPTTSFVLLPSCTPLYCLTGRKVSVFFPRPVIFKIKELIVGFHRQWDLRSASSPDWAVFCFL